MEGSSMSFAGGLILHVKAAFLLGVAIAWMTSLSTVHHTPKEIHSFFDDVEEVVVYRSEERPAPKINATYGIIGDVRRFAFKTSVSVELHAEGKQWEFQELEGVVPNMSCTSAIMRTSPLITKSAATRLLALSRQLLYEDGPDSVDWLPTFEAPLLRDGVQLPSSSQFMKTLSQVITYQALPYVRNRFHCSTCVACTSLIRRYNFGERRHHPSHYDRDAFVTMIMPLTPAMDYRGGFYIQPSSDRIDKEFPELEAGDALFHSHDLMHGVEMVSGERVVLIIWFQTNGDACKSGS